MLFHDLNATVASSSLSCVGRRCLHMQLFPGAIKVIAARQGKQFSDTPRYGSLSRRPLLRVSHLANFSSVIHSLHRYRTLLRSADSQRDSRDITRLDRQGSFRSLSKAFEDRTQGIMIGKTRSSHTLFSHCHTSRQYGQQAFHNDAGNNGIDKA